MDPPLLKRVLGTLFPEESGEEAQWVEPSPYTGGGMGPE